LIWVVILARFLFAIAQKFHPSKIVTVEPDKNNLHILKKNIQLNNLSETLLLVEKAVYKTTGKIGFQSQLVNKGMNVIDQNEKSKLVPTLTLKDLFSQTKLKQVDFLKIDIEGGERYVLTAENAKLLSSQVKYIFMETHSRLGTDKRAPEKYLKKLGFHCKYSEVWHNPGCGALEAVNPRFHTTPV